MNGHDDLRGESPMMRQLSNDAMLRHMERLVAAGDWDCLKPYLRAAERSAIPEAILKARFDAGHCVGCDRSPCDHCGTDNPLWCEVCWKLIRENCPEGMVVSGVAWVMQHLSKGFNRTP